MGVDAITRFTWCRGDWRSGTPCATMRAMRWSFFGSGALAAALALTATQASANGRFPEANHVYVSPTNPDHVILRVSFGLLVSRDGGASWRWVCEQVLGLAGDEDPMYAFGASSALLSATYHGVTVSRDDACSWPRAPVGPDDALFVDLTQRAADRSRTVVLESTYRGQGPDGGAFVFSSRLHETRDDGASFTPLGAEIDSSLQPETVDLAPSDPARVYVSGVRTGGGPPEAVLLASRDAGATWVPHLVPLVAGERSLFIAAVDATNPDRLYVRTSNALDQPTRLLLSEDAGKTFRTIFSAKGGLLGFALSPDGTKVYVGGRADGLHVASTQDFVFRQTSSVQVQCITATPEHVWVCSNETNGFIAARTRDDGATFEGQSRFRDIQGPLACPSSTEYDQCVTGWPILRIGLGLDPRDAGSDAGPAVAPPVVAEGDGGCSCRSAGASPWAGTMVVMASIAALLGRLRASSKRGERKNP